MLVFMCMQDSGYTEGSRAELIALLESRGIARGRSGAVHHHGLPKRY